MKRNTTTSSRRRSVGQRTLTMLVAASILGPATPVLASTATSQSQPAQPTQPAKSSAPASDSTPKGEASASDAEEATRLRELAEQRFFEEDFAGALSAFEQASELDPHPTDLFNMGRIREEMGELEMALQQYEEFVSQPKVPLEERAAAAERIQVLRQVIEQVAPEEESPQPRGANEDPFADRGPEPEQYRKQVITGIALTSVGAAIAIGGGVGFGISARRNSDRVADLSDGRNPDRLSLREAEDLEALGRDFETLQIVSLATGGTMAIVGTVLLATGLRRRARSRREARVRLEAVGPALSAQRLGLQTSWRF